MGEPTLQTNPSEPLTSELLKRNEPAGSLRRKQSLKSQKLVELRDESLKIEKTASLQVRSGGASKKGIWVLERDQVVWRVDTQEEEKVLMTQEDDPPPPPPQAVLKFEAMRKSQSGNLVTSANKVEPRQVLTRGRNTKVGPPWSWKEGGGARAAGLAQQLLKSNYERIGAAGRVRSLAGRREGWE